MVRRTVQFPFRLGGLVLAVSCVQPVDAPELVSMDPAWGWNGESTDVVLLGNDFYPGIAATGSDRFEIDRQFDAWLTLEGNRTPLEGVSLQELDALSARVPAGLEPGRYDVGLRTPNGDESILARGFSVTATRADHIELDTASLTHPVMSLARVGMQLLDPANASVAEAISVQVAVIGAEDPGTLRFEDTLDDQRWDGTLPGIRGTLSAGGTGFVAMTSEIPSDLWLEITAADEDSVVRGASQFLAFTAGGVASIEVALPHADDTPVAGEAFPVRLTLRDERGNPTDGAVASVTLVERCGDADTRFRRSVVFADEIELSDAYLTGATGPEGCAANGLEVIGQADGAALQGSSRDVMVQPGQPDGLRLQVFPPVIQVGESPVLVVVEAEDAWGNKTTSVEGSLQLEDSEGGLGLEAGAYECQSMVAGVATCEASPVRAADAVLVTATMVDGLAGTAPPLTVLAGAADRLDVVVSPPTVAAGDLFDLRLRTVDAWDNPVGIDPTGTDVPVFEDGEASVSCAWTGSEGSDGEERFACAATHAEPTKTIHVALPAGATGTSPPFEVTNGPLADATLDLGGVRELTAGDPLDLSVQARDTWGNPYIVQTVSSVDIYDKSGEVVAEPVALDGGGAGTLRLRPTVAWASNQLDAYAGTALLGRSSAFDVIAGAAVDLGVELPATWAEVGDPVPVKVIAEDAYGNPVRGFSGTVVLRSSLSAADDASASVFDEGVANAVMQWERVALQDTIRAEGGGLSGVSAGVDAVQRCEGGGPTAELEIGGDLDHVTCRVGGITPSTNLDASGSTPGSTALLATHFAPSAGTWLRVSATSTNVTWDSVGANEVRAVVVDIAGCFDDTTARAWVGDSDGEPVGPVSLSPASTALVAGSTTLGSTTVDISATDCAGDPAGGGTLAVRADLGALSSGSSMLTATGAGLELALDASGHGQVTWSMTTTAHDGVATLHAGTPAGSAHGTTTGSVSGEFAPPTVVTAEPSGTRSGTFSAVHLTFSEEMLGSSLTTSTVALTAPDGTLVPDLALSMADTTLTMTLDSPQDAGSGVWSIGVGSGARDLAGNRLDGAWTGGSSAFLLTFGLVPDIAPDMTDCVAATTTIRPDGDDGSGDESDDLEVALQATGTPAWWEILVLDDDGLVFAEREAGSAAAMTVSWNGRDQRGMVVEEGRYSVRFTPMDASWNPGDGCTVPVTVAHRVAAPRGAP